MSDRVVVCVSTELEGSLLRAAALDSVDVLPTGVGSVNAAVALTRYLEHNQPSSILVCGIAGAYPDSGLSIGDVVCAESECYGDLGAASADGFLDMRDLGFPLVAAPEPLYNVFPLQIFPAPRLARFVTVNTCTGTNASARAMVARTGGSVESMEGAAIAHVAALARVPVGEIRGISNIAGDRNRSTWRVKEAAEAAQKALLAWLESD